MKKLVSILLCAVMLSVYLTVFTVPAMATDFEVNNLEDLYKVLDDDFNDDFEEGDTIKVKGNGETWLVYKVIDIDEPSCHIIFENINFLIGDDDDGDFNEESLIEVNKPNVTLDFYNCTLYTALFDVDGDGELVCEADGGAIHVDGHNCTINGNNSTIFDSCRTTNDYGGAICVHDYNNCTIKNAKFINCDCTEDGGAIYVDGDNCTIDNCEFSGCEASEKGGAIYIEGNGGHVSNCKFSGCSANEGGSNIYSYNNGEVIVIDCKDADGNLIDESTCFNCDLDADTYMRQNFPTCVRHPASLEEGYYVIRSAVDSKYGLDIQGGTNKAILNPVDESKAYLVKKNPYGSGYKIYHNKNIFIGGSFDNIGTQIVELPDQGHVWVGSHWDFESDAPGGDDHYYIHADSGIWMEACLDNQMPWAGTRVQSNCYFGSENQVWVLEKVDAPSGFTLAGGNTWIIIAGAVVILGGIVAIVVNNKKKKAVPAEGEVTVTETSEKTEE